MKVNLIVKKCLVRGGVFLGLLQLGFLAHSMMNIFAFAALAPVYESQREYEAILTDPRLRESLNGHLLTSVSQNGETILIVAENDCVIRGLIRTIPRSRGWVGPRNFEIAVLRVDTGCENEVAVPTFSEHPSETRLRDFRNLVGRLGSFSADLKMAWVQKIEIFGADQFRISTNAEHWLDIPLSPSGS